MMKDDYYDLGDFRRPLPAGLVQLLSQFDQIGVTGAQRLGQVGDFTRLVFQDN